MTTMQQRIDEVERRIQLACSRSGRSRDEIQVIAVTKYVSEDTTLDAVRHGLRQLGENRWQDAQAKWHAVQSMMEKPPTWHFIGSLQTNKVKEVVGRFAWIHSLDRPSLAKEINRKAEQLGIQVPCMIQINVSGEDTKYGLHPEELAEFAASLASLPHLRPAGLMTMAPYEAVPEETRPVFRRLRELRDELNQAAVLPEPLRELSMGMSNDFEIAVEEGATWLRLGTVLVGKEEEA